MSQVFHVASSNATLREEACVAVWRSRIIPGPGEPHAAAVRIAMTVAALGEQEERLLEVTKEQGLDTDAPEV